MANYAPLDPKTCLDEELGIVAAVHLGWKQKTVNLHGDHYTVLVGPGLDREVLYPRTQDDGVLYNGITAQQALTSFRPDDDSHCFHFLLKAVVADPGAAKDRVMARWGALVVAEQVDMLCLPGTPWDAPVSLHPGDIAGLLAVHPCGLTRQLLIALSLEGHLKTDEPSHA